MDSDRLVQLLVEQVEWYIKDANCTEEYEIPPPPGVVEKIKKLMNDNPALIHASVNKGMSLLQFLGKHELIDRAKYDSLWQALIKPLKNGV